MTDDALLVRPPPPNTWHMYRALVGVGLLCGLLIVTAYELTRPVIERNQAEALRRAIFQVLPSARTSTPFRLGDAGAFEAVAGAPGDGASVHACWDEAQRLVGFAIEAHGMGYQDVVRLLYGYSLDADAITGVRVLESRETPGLGDKIETDAAFLANFERLDVSLTGDGAQLAHPIEFVKPGAKQHPWQIDGITGATVSSTAVADILRKSAARWIPQIRRRLDDFAEAP
jgi:electron transport complex protein RnfG